MSKYRKKPIVVEAIQFTWDKQLEAISFIGNRFWQLSAAGKLCISTLEGTMVADEGDYIIKGIKGELYPCKPDIFEATYEEVEND